LYVLFIEFDIITLLGILLLHKMFACFFHFWSKYFELSRTRGKELRATERRKKGKEKRERWRFLIQKR